MRHQLETSIIINADLETVWNTFINFEAYPAWETFIKSVKGDMKVGARLEAEITGMTFRPTVQIFEEKKELTWLGKLWFSGIFDGRHTFRFSENEDGTTTFSHSEKFRGILVPLMKKKLKTDILEGFEHFNRTLKEKAEK
ncbi:MAG: SRPBCC domain-containing protein [Crocinitomicaceae bacterium]